MKVLVFLGLILVLVPSVMAQEGPDLEDLPDVPACQEVDGSRNSAVRIGVPDGTVSDGGVFCRVINNGEGYVGGLSAATIGDMGVISRGVQAAVDIFGISNMEPVNTLAQSVNVCLRGTGVFVFLDANYTPRIAFEMPAVTRNINGADYTCANISAGGMAVLVQGPAAPPFSEVQLAAPPPSANGETVVEGTDGEMTETTTAAPVVQPVFSGASTPLDGCRVQMTAIVRLRTQPNLDSDVITRLPFRLTLEATERIDGWFRVIYQNGQGWVSDSFVQEVGTCGAS